MASGRPVLPPRRVGVAVKPSSADAVALGRRLLDELARRGLAGVADAESAPALGAPPGPTRAQLGREVDLIFVLGGDGTFLSVTRSCPASTPVAGVNLGTLGFLTEHAPDATIALLDDAVAGRLAIEERGRLRVRVEGPEDGREFLVLNDVVVTKAALARILTIAVEVEGELMSRYRADGLILATPTGSTAYNLSAGGPIVHPRLDAMLITPICPHTLTNRPLAVPDHLQVRVWAEPGEAKVYVTLDGQTGFPLTPEMRVAVGPKGEPLSLVRLAGASFFTILHHKLKWGEREG
jgi:NAD+ kinase